MWINKTLKTHNSNDMEFKNYKFLNGNNLNFSDYYCLFFPKAISKYLKFLSILKIFSKMIN